MISIGSNTVTVNGGKKTFIMVFAAFFFFLILILPTTFQLERGILLAGLVAVGSVTAFSRWRVSRDIFMLWLLTLSVGVAGVLWGFFNGAPGALHVSTVYILWPIVYMLFVGLVHSPRTIVLLEKTIVLGVAVSSLMALALLVIAVSRNVQIANEIFAFQGASIGLYDGFYELTLFNLTTVIYGLPYLTSLFFLPQVHGWIISRKWVGWMLMLALAVCLVSGRRAFWLLAIVTPVMVWGLFFLARIHIRVQSVAFAAMLMAIVTAVGASVLNFSSLSEQFASAFDSLGEESASLRYQQFEVLMAGWSSSPLIGQGLGASA
ncbi:MAG TPA: hypothetical protein EYO59_07495, partial [Chromatiaceae bacterium]|nr:hypothetical protein [Chromatiaceae bacterium]